MELQHIELGKLKVSAVNMRHARQAPDVSDILPSVKARGVLVLSLRADQAPAAAASQVGRARLHGGPAVGAIGSPARSSSRRTSTHCSPTRCIPTRRVCCGADQACRKIASDSTQSREPCRIRSDFHPAAVSIHAVI